MREFQVRILAEVIFFTINFFTVIRMILINIEELTRLIDLRRIYVEFTSRIKGGTVFLKSDQVVGAQCIGIVRR